MKKSKMAGTIVMATVKGDVNDIGKNIIGTALACNGFRIIDLGVNVPCKKILQEAKQHHADIIGLSGLINPSLDEMVHVASELQHQGFSLPLLIGGASTSPAHTADKIAPAYKNGLVIHSQDVSHCVDVCRSLMDPKLKQDLTAKVRKEYTALRREYLSRQSSKTFVSVKKAREKALLTDWKQAVIIKPSFLGVKVFRNFDLNLIRQRINWSPFFMAWELKGKFPQIFKDPALSDEARRLYNDANAFLDEIIEKKLLKANAVVGFFPANSVGDDIEVYSDDNRRKVAAVFYNLRQQIIVREDQPLLSHADYVAPKSSKVKDYIGAFAVTAGIGLDDLKSTMSQAVAHCLVDAFAELMHEKVRTELWGHVPYRGIRPSPGHPSFPDHTEKATLFRLLDATQNTGIHLTETFAMFPTASVCGLYFAHPQSKYFAINKINKAQITNYAKRKKISVQEAEKWLGANLGY